MKKISTGADSTLGNWIAMTAAVLGEDSPAVKFLRKKAEESPNDMNEEVIADEGQLIQTLFYIHTTEV
jgi:hypothetical protein